MLELDPPRTSAASQARIGIVSSDPRITQAIALGVMQAGARPVIAANADEAAEMMRDRGYAFLVLDHRSAELLPMVGPACHGCAFKEAADCVDALALLVPSRGRGSRVLFFSTQQIAELIDEMVHRLPGASVESALAAIKGYGPAMELVREQARSVARYRDVPVLILGETGTGKELLAQAIHKLSGADRGAFVAINCAAIPENLFESELFGHEAGAYTGARGARIGLLESAGAGTIFFDEVGEMPLPLQAKLLRALETRTFRRVGANRDLPLHARIVSATNRGLGGWSEATLRADLLYRLAGFTITLPPLRERGADIELLASTFLRAFAERHRAETKWFSPEAVAALRGHAWPGNVRELRSLVEQVAIVSRGPEITARDIQAALARAPKRKRSSAPPAPENAPSAPKSVVSGDSMPSTGGLRDVERELIMRAYAESDRNLTRAARQLAIPRTTLRDKLRKYGAL